MPRAVVQVIIRGRVQGVGYRAFVADAAMANGLKGWVRNRRNGSVEAMLVGAAEDVAAVIAQCRIGPSLARVEDVEMREVQDEGWAEFAIRSTV